MSNRAWIMIIIILAIIIAILSWLLFTTPAYAPSAPVGQIATSTPAGRAPAATTSQSQTEPLDKQVVVTFPASNATVSHSFEITGTAPGGWFFEAVFPIQVRDPNDDLIGSSQGRAQSDWTVPGPIAFTSRMTVSVSYHGPANLILLKDNPSGNPETMDSVTIPIIVR